MTSIQEFCKKHKTGNTMEQAFTMYVKATYSSSLAIHPGETLNKIISNLTMEQVEDAWIKFVFDPKETLPEV